MLRRAAWTAMALAGCARTSATASPTVVLVEYSDVASLPAAPASPCEANAARIAPMFRARSVDAARFAQRVVYSWTTPEQVEELRAAPVLLTREVSPTRGVSFYDVVAERVAERGEPVMKALRAPRFRKARFAWNSAWATMRGWPGERYGDKLLRISLRDNAWVVGLSARTNTVFRVLDMANREVARSEVIAHPERVGAVYFVQDEGWGVTGSAPARGFYREYVLPNEAMIASWEADTPAAYAEVDAGVEMNAGLLEAMTLRCPSAAPYTDVITDAPGVWGSALPESATWSPRVAWGQVMSIGSRYYVFTPEAVRDVLTALRAVPRGGAPLRHAM